MASIRGRINIVSIKLNKSRELRKKFIKKRDSFPRNSRQWKKFQKKQLNERVQIERRRINLKELTAGRKLKHEVKKVKAKAKRTAIGALVVGVGIGLLAGGASLLKGAKKTTAPKTSLIETGVKKSAPSILKSLRSKDVAKKGKELAKKFKMDLEKGEKGTVSKVSKKPVEIFGLAKPVSVTPLPLLIVGLIAVGIITIGVLRR